MITRSFICDLGADGIHVDSLDDIHVTVELISELRAGRTFKQAAFDAAFRYFGEKLGRSQVVVDVREDNSDRALEDLAHAIDGLRAYRDKGDLVAELARAIHAGGAVVEELYGVVGPRVALEWVNKKLDEGETHRGLRPFRARLLTAFPELADEDETAATVREETSSFGKPPKVRKFVVTCPLGHEAESIERPHSPWRCDECDKEYTVKS